MKKVLLLFTVILSSLISMGQSVSIGDILCTDGTTVSAADFPTSGRTACGIVFYVDDNDTHGWAVALQNQSSSIKWSSPNFYGYDIPNLVNYENARTAMHNLDGSQNTGIIRSEGDANDFPAAWAVDYDDGWFLPSAAQLRYMYSYYPEINASLQVVGGSLFPLDGNYYWWSSTEFSSFHAYDMNTGGSIGDYVKDNHSNYPPNGIAVRQIIDFNIPNPVPATYHIGDIITNDDGSQGILFYVSPDQTEGWMVALNDASTSIPWGNGDVPGLVNQTYASPFGMLLNETDGYDNTGIIKDYQNGMNTAANVVDYENGWYLPSAGQLSKLFGALPFIENKLHAYGSILEQSDYWSSSEANANEAFAVSFRPSGNVRAGGFIRSDKGQNYHVRAVRNINLFNPSLPEPTLPDNILESDCNIPLEGNAWNVNLLFSTAANTICSYAPVIAGDIDDNGVTDLVISHYNGNNYRTNTLDIYSGLNLSLQYRFNIQDSIYNSNGPYAIGKYTRPDGTQQGAIFVHGYDKKIRAYTINGTLLNVSDRATSCDGMVSLADFNGDGYPEVYVGSDIFDAATLKWLCSGPENGNKGLGYRGAAYGVVNYHLCYFAMSLASNVLGDTRQELICGNTIYNVNIVSRTNPALNSVTTTLTIMPPTGYSQDGHTSLADFDLDGECEVLVVRDDTDDHTFGTCYMYAYKPSNGQILFQNTVQCLCTGYPLIGNIDNDPHPEIVFLEKQNSNPMYLYCWRYTNQSGLTTVWRQPHNDTSGQTGITLFDFNQDNIMELVYRDSENLRIINGSGKSHITGNDTICPYNLYARMMGAGTGCEYPIVADINGDGSAEIVTTGLLDHTGNLLGHGGIHVFGNLGNWASARKVWNQYMYHVTNVNEDLTIPTYCFEKATVFTAPDGTERRPYNNFLQQASYINQYGEPYNPGGAIEVSISGSGCESYTFHGVTYTESGHYEQLVESETSCDTLYNIEVSIGGTVTFGFSESHCKSFTWNETTYEESGYYIQEFQTLQGCDSIVTLHLTITGTITKEWSTEACDHYVWNGTTYNEPGDYMQEFVTPEGCDSIVTLHLTFSDTLEVDTDSVACGSLWWNGQEYTESGHYEQQFVTVDGCDSLVRMDLTVLPFPESIPEIIGLQEVYVSTDIVLGKYHYSIDSVEFATHYEWILEDADWTMDTTGTHCTLWVTTPGTATLKVRAWNDCGYTEQEIIINAGFFDVDDNHVLPIAVYPNPAHDKVFIKAEDIICVKLFNLQGQCLMERRTEPCERMELLLGDHSASFYLIEIQTQHGTVRTKLQVNP